MAAALATVAVWAFSYSAIKVALGAFDPGGLAALRNLIAGAVLAGAMFVTGARLPRLEDLPRLLVAGALGIGAYQGLLNLGEQSVGVGAAAFIIGTAPVFTALLGVILLKEAVNGRSWLAILISFLGIGVIALSDGRGRIGAGALFVLASALSIAMQIVLQRPLASRYSALELTTYMIVAGDLSLSPFLPGAVGDAVEAVAAANWNPVLALAFLALLPGALGYTLWTYAAGGLKVAQLAAFLYLVAPLSACVAALWLREPVAPLTLIGGGLAVAGVALLNSWARREPREAEPALPPVGAPRP